LDHRGHRSRQVAALLVGAALGLTPQPASGGHAEVPVVVAVRADYVRRLMDLQEKMLFVDLRGSSAFRAGHLPGAISIPIAEMDRRYGELPRAGRVILYCDCPPDELASAYALLRSKGYDNHAVLEDGYRGWIRLDPGARHDGR
jgi:ArsR family transcriptional regulator